MLRRDVIRTLVMLHTIDTLISHCVWIFALKACRLESSVVVHKKVTLEALTSNIFIEVDHVLIIHLHEVNLYTFHSPIAVCIKNILHILHHRSP